MSDIEAAARGGAFSLLVLLAMVLWRDGRALAPARVGALLSLSVCAYVAGSAPPLAALSLHEAVWIAPVRLVGMGVPALFWLYSAACFDDELRLSWRHSLPWMGAVVLGAICLLGPWPQLWLVYTATSLGFVAMACWQAATGRDADLIESRRRFRLLLLGLISAYTVVTIVGNLGADHQQSASASLADAAGLLAMVFLVCSVRLALRRTVDMRPVPVVAPLPADPPPSPAPSADVPAAVAPVPDEADDGDSAALLDRLRGLMEEQRIYREEGLSIAGLAERMGLPEYRLRRLINQRLGHRNFSAFVNGYRLAETTSALSDPAQAEVPILTIALDAGFQSIGPFNRAFKAHTGKTPTEYRRARLGAGSIG